MSLKERLDRVREKIASVAVSCGRRPSEIQLVAVSKSHPHEAIREAYEAGQRVFGENYVQELLAKQEALSDLVDLQWHYIGHLQRNKVKSVVGKIAMIETVDSIRLLEEIQSRAWALKKRVDVLIQVNIGDEESKSGCAVESAGDLLNAALTSSCVTPRGLMVIPPYESGGDESRKHFRALRELRDRLGGIEVLPKLSMGMSHDFEIAIEEGATFVRIGTAIFGHR